MRLVLYKGKFSALRIFQVRPYIGPLIKAMETLLPSGRISTRFNSYDTSFLTYEVRLETCSVLENAIDNLVMDAIKRGNSLVLEGVGIVPSSDILDKWRGKGGVAMGVVMNISSSEDHKKLLHRRGEMTRKGEENKLREFERIRMIQDEMVRRGREHGWLVVEQKVEPAPIEIIGDILKGSAAPETQSTAAESE